MTTPSHAVSRGWAWPGLLLSRPTLSDVPIWAGVAAAAMGTIAILGWIFDSAILKSMIQGLPTMKANAAVSFILLGVGVVLRARAGAGSAHLSVGFVLVGAAAAVAFVTGAEYIGRVDYGIDQLLFHESASSVASGVAGRMSPLTAICFILIAGGTLIGARAPRIVVGLCGVALAVSVLSVLTFVFNADVPPFLSGYSQMALGTAVAMAILAIGVIGLLGPAGPFASLAGRYPGTMVVRGALALSIGVPLSMIAVTLAGQQLGFFDASYGIALRLLGMMSLGVTGSFGAARWVKDAEAKREALEVERDRFFDLSLDMLSVVGAHGRFRRVNRAWESALGYRAEDLVGRPYLDLVHPDDRERTIEQAQRHYELGEPVRSFQNRYRHLDGSYRWLEWVSQTAPDGSVAFAVARDITGRKGEEDRRERRQRALENRAQTLTERAIRDPLTGLHNRRYFDAAVGRLERRWRRLAAARRPPVSVILFDLDQFGEVNKLHGHQAGDAVLRVFAGLLKKRFRKNDHVARYGGEEFVAVLEGTTSEAAIRIAEEIRARFEGTAIDIGSDSPIRVTVSAGCAELGDDRVLSEGLSHADVWLSQAKRAGRNQVVGL